MTAAPTELDPDTKRRLADEVERLVRMGTERKKARRLVWDDYLDELAAQATPTLSPVPECPEAEPVTRPVSGSMEALFFTPERLQKNRAELVRVKQLVGLRSKR